ncbi:MAG: aspartate kinase [Promethearchaeota archaeon]
MIYSEKSNSLANLEIPIHIMKFGGSCIHDEKSFEQIKKITELYESESKIYVLSALNGITELLIQTAECANSNKTDELLKLIKIIESKHSQLIESLFKEKLKARNEAQKNLQIILLNLWNVLDDIKEFGITPYFTDYIMSFGEKLSNLLLSSYLANEKYDVISFSGEDLIITNDTFNDALPDLYHTKNRIKERLLPKLFQDFRSPIVCITGFIGRNKIGYTTTLGRGGSDFSATIIARCLYEINSDFEIKISLWKDVDGILTSNPNYVASPQLIPKLSYQEAMEMAFIGAKVLHPKCLEIIEKQNIPIEIRNFNSPTQSECTIISQNSTLNNIKGVNVVENLELITITSPTLMNSPGFLGKVFSLLGINEINVNMISQSCSQTGISFTIEKSQFNQCIVLLTSDKELPPEWISITHQPVGIVAIIGKEIFQPLSITKISNVFSQLAISPIAIAQNDDGMNLSIVLPQSSLKQTVNLINDSLISTETEKNIFQPISIKEEPM